MKISYQISLYDGLYGGFEHHFPEGPVDNILADLQEQSWNCAVQVPNMARGSILGGTQPGRQGARSLRIQSTALREPMVPAPCFFQVLWEARSSSGG